MITKISIVYAPVPYIMLETDNVINANGVGQTEIDFNELSAYVSILTQQQTALGKYVNFFKGTYTVNNRNFDAIVIQPSDTPEPGTGAAVIVSLTNAPTDVCGVAPSLVYMSHGSPIVAGDFLFSDTFLAVPLTGFDTVQDATTGEIFALNTLTGEVGAATGAFCNVPNPVPPAGNTLFKVNGVNFDVSNDLTTQSGVSSVTVDTATYNANPYAVFFRLPTRGFGNFFQEYNIPVGVTVQAVDDGAGLWGCVALFQFALPTCNITTKTAATQNTVKITTGVNGTDFDYISVIPFTGAAGGASMQMGGTYKQLQDQARLAYCGKVDGVAGTVYHVIAKSPYNDGASTCVVSFWNNGVFVSTLPGFSCVMGGQDNFDIAGDTDCPAPALYDEINFVFVDGGATPPGTKNVWFVNNTGAAVQFSSDTDPAINIPIGGGLNVPLTPSGTLTNESAFSVKCTFIQSMPATLAPLEAPNPDTLIASGVHNLNADLSLLNYCKVELP